MRRRIAGFLITTVFLATLPTAAMAADVLTWERCAQEAMINHPELSAAKEVVTQAKADKGIARSSMLPELIAEAGKNRTKNSSGTKNTSYSYSVNGRQLLFDGFKSVAQTRAAGEMITAQEYNYAVRSSNVRLDLRTAFVRLLRAQQLIGLTEEISKRRKQNLDLVQLRYQAGREHKGALLTAQADFAQAEFEVAQSARNLSLAQNELLKQIGARRKKPVHVQGEFMIREALNPDPDFEVLTENSPFLKEVISRKDAARFAYGAARSEFLPSIYLSGAYGETDSDWPPEKEEWSAGLTISLPLFEGGSRMAKAAKSKSVLRQLESEEQSGRDSVLFVLRQSWKNFQDAADTVLVKGKFLEAALERAKIANAQYSTGLISFNDWIIIENNLVSAKKAYLDAQTDAVIAEAGWIQAKGGTLEHDDR